MDITRIRLDRGMSQKRLAMEAGVHAKTVRRIERGEPVQPENLRQVRKVLDIDDATPVEEVPRDERYPSEDPGWWDWRVAWARMQASTRIQALVTADRRLRRTRAVVVGIWIGIGPAVLLSLTMIDPPEWVANCLVIAIIPLLAWSLTWGMAARRCVTLAGSIVPDGAISGAHAMIDAVRTGELVLTTEQRSIVVLLVHQGQLEIARAELEARMPDPMLDEIRVPVDQGVGEAACLRD